MTSARGRYGLLLLVAPLVPAVLFTGCDSQNLSSPQTKSTVDANTSEPPQDDHSSDQRTVIVEQSGRCFEIEPLSANRSVENFYRYQNAHSNTPTGLERSDVSLLFLYASPTGRKSLVILHDKPGDERGGTASFDFRGLPTGVGNWIVRDDQGDFRGSGSATSPHWTWVGPLNDGGVWRGGLNGSFEITIDPTFRQGITEWQVLSKDATTPDRTNLDLETPVTIGTTASCKVEAVIDIKPGSDPNAVNPESRGVIPVAVLHTDTFNPVDRADVSTLRFGDPEDVEENGAESAHGGHVEDVDQDGDDDLVLHFPTPESDFEGDEDKGKLVGETRNETSLSGTDTVKLVGRGNGGPPASSGLDEN